jgi:hypothetical protein
MPGFWPGREVKLQRSLNFTRESLSVAVTAYTMPRVTKWPAYEEIRGVHLRLLPRICPEQSPAMPRLYL